MRFAAPVVVLAALLAQSALANNNNNNNNGCPPGKYWKKIGDGRHASWSCTVCPTGEFTNKWDQADCKQCDAGKTNNHSHTGCDNCPPGTWSSKGGACHQTCPAGQQLVNGHCEKCAPGWYNSTPGGQCKKCDKGEFNNVYGATKCCDCCAGWYADSKGSTLCKKCSDNNRNKPNGPVGSDSAGKCSRDTNSDCKTATSSCTMVADNVCPNPHGDGPQGTAISHIKRNMRCANGLTACARFSGRGGVDCVDTENDPESCGGCVGVDGEGDGTDCTAIKGVSVTRCVNKSCVIDSCRKGFVKSIDGSSCVLASHATDSADVLHAQEADAKLKRSSAKRAIRHTMF